MMFSRQIGARVIIELVALLLIVVGLVFGVVALFGMRTHGKSGILAPAIVGIIINGLLLFIFVTNFLAARARAQQRRGDVPSLAAASSPARAARPEYNTLSDIPAELRSELESFARRFEADFRSRDSNAVRRAFDAAAIAEGVCEGIQGSQKSLSQFKNGLQEGVTRSTGRLVQQWSQGEAKYKGLVLYKGAPAARFRFAGEPGLALVDMALRRSSQGKVRVVNFCNHAMGYDLVEQGRQMVAPMLADLDKGFLARLLNKPNISPGDAKRFGDMAKKFAGQDYAGVVSAYQGLPPALRETMTASMMHINALQNLGDDDKYKQALKEAAKRFKFASFQFMLVDVYYLDQEYDKAIECIDNFMQTLEKDAALIALKSLMLNAKGDIKGAQTVLSEAFKLEPDCIFAHSKGLDVLLAAKDFAGVRDSMILLEQKGGHAFKDAMDDPLWDEFKKAPESARGGKPRSSLGAMKRPNRGRSKLFKGIGEGSVHRRRGREGVGPNF